MKSWKTTTAAIAAIAAVIGTAINAQFDTDPATVPDWGLTVSVVLAAVIGLFARDNNVTSEAAGAK